MKIPLTVPSIEEDDLKAVSDVIKSGYLVQGEKVSNFEKNISNYVGTKYAVAVSSCTAALHLSLLALGIKEGDIVVVTAYSWIATANVIELCGAKPIFVDIQSDTFNMDPEQLDVILSNMMGSPAIRKKVKAILPVHTFGQMADMEAIIKLADYYGIAVIEDAACALGATWKSKQAGTWGIMGCFSFHPRKNITTGEGGIIVTDDANIDSKLKALRNHGQNPNSDTFDFICPGFNYRMTEFQAAFGLTQLEKLNRIISKRRMIALYYNELLEDTIFQAPTIPPDSIPIYQSYVALLKDKSTINRDELIIILKKLHIETNIGTLNIPLTTYYKKRYGFQLGEFPITENVFKRAITLPVFERMEEKEQQRVVAALIASVKVKKEKF